MVDDKVRKVGGDNDNAGTDGNQMVKNDRNDNAGQKNDESADVINERVENMSPVKDIPGGKVKETVDKYENMAGSNAANKADKADNDDDNVNEEDMLRDGTPDDLRFKNIMEESQGEANAMDGNVEMARAPMSTSPPRVSSVADKVYAGLVWTVMD